MDAEEARGGALLERAYLERLSKPERDELLIAIVAAAPTVESVVGHEAELIEQTVEAVRVIFGLIDTIEQREAELADTRKALTGIAEMVERQADDVSRDVVRTRALLAKVMILAHAGLRDLSSWTKEA